MAISGTLTNFVYLDGIGLIMPHMIVDTDVPSWTNLTNSITNYKGDITKTAYYESNEIDTNDYLEKSIYLSKTLDYADLNMLDITYPDRTDLTYPQDTDLLVTPELSFAMYYKVDNGSYQEYFDSVNMKFRKIKLKLDLQVVSQTARVIVNDFFCDIQYVEKQYNLYNIDIPQNGLTIIFANYDLEFHDVPKINVVPLNSALVPEVVATNTVATVKLKNLQNNYVNGTATIEIGGI